MEVLAVEVEGKSGVGGLERLVAGGEGCTRSMSVSLEKEETRRSCVTRWTFAAFVSSAL